MKAIRKITSNMVPLRRSDVDTDQIIPSEWMKRVERTGFGKGLFSQWREDPNFVLNDPSYIDAHILVAGANFGTGSSREHAVWALQDYGFEAVISSRFGDIFRNNCTKVGILPIVLGEEEVERLMSLAEQNAHAQTTIDLETLTLSCDMAQLRTEFQFDDFTRYRFLEGLDDIGLTLRFEEAITAFETHRPSFYPVLQR